MSMAVTLRKLSRRQKDLENVEDWRIWEAMHAYRHVYTHISVALHRVLAFEKYNSPKKLSSHSNQQIDAQWGRAGNKEIWKGIDTKKQVLSIKCKDESAKYGLWP